MSGAKWSDIMNDDILPPFPYRIVLESGQVIPSGFSKKQAMEYLENCVADDTRKVIDNNDQPFER